MRNRPDLAELAPGCRMSFLSVIPAEAGIQALQSCEEQDWTPAFAGVTTLVEGTPPISTSSRHRPYQTGRGAFLPSHRSESASA
jgi:hypothetical protein